MSQLSKSIVRTWTPNIRHPYYAESLHILPLLQCTLCVLFHSVLFNSSPFIHSLETISIFSQSMVSDSIHGYNRTTKDSIWSMLKWVVHSTELVI